MGRVRKNPVLVRDDSTTPAVARPAFAGEHESAPAQLPLALPEQAGSPAAARRLWFCIHLPRLSLEACPASDAARAVVEEQQGVHKVLLADHEAAAAGVIPGQSANAALALMPTLVLEERNPLREQQALESLAGWLEQFSSQVSIATDDVLLLEIAGSLRLFGGLRALRQQVAAGLETQGFSAALAIAPTPLAATWLARGARRLCVRDAANLVPALRTLPTRVLDWPPALTESLTGMGVTNVGDCLRLPREGFARRFGARRLMQLDQALGRLPDPRQSWRSPERFMADYEMTEEQSDSELLLAICRELLQSHEQFLLVRQLGTQRLRFTFFHLKAAATSLVLGVADADRAAGRWFDLLKLRFERISLPEAVIAVRLEGGATQALRAEPGRLEFRQKRQRPTGRYSMTQLAERLSARLGEQGVQGVMTVAEHRPQLAWRQREVLAGRTADVTVRSGPQRPLWMLPEPILLPAEQGLPLHQGRLMLVEGPERLETGWWDDCGIARDYYTAVNPRGMRLWVFRNRTRQSGWYLHGLFG